MSYTRSLAITEKTHWARPQSTYTTELRGGGWGGGGVEVFEEYNMAKSRNNLLHKVVEKCDLNPVEMIYLYISSQKKTSYGSSKNLILIQDSDTRQK